MSRPIPGTPLRFMPGAPGSPFFSDGLKCTELDQSESEGAREKPLSGFVGIQDSHAGEGSYVEYRNIQLKLLE